MIYTDTRDKSVQTNFRTAVLNGMNSATGGLYIPVEFPKLDPSFFNRTTDPSFREVAFAMAKPFVEGEIPDADLEAIIEDCYPFSSQVVPVDPSTFVLELFHGPTCAFKDFGARFMARVMSYFNKGEKDNLHILVATSGDTGSAVGSAFHNVPGIDVTILYPEGKVSLLQEKQLSTFTGNVRALKVKGNFDDCQKLVKTAFTDKELREKFRLSSANSINISRLLPQAFYYTYSSMVVKNKLAAEAKTDTAILAVCPSGNFGNLTSGLIAKEMGAPIDGFVAATNSNHTVPDWIASGEYKIRPSVETLSNAMDVGAPSNWERINALYTLDQVRQMFASYWTDDEGTIKGIKECFDSTGYIIDPHGAVAWKAWNDMRNGDMKKLVDGTLEADMNKPGLTKNVPEWAQKVTDKKACAILLETAHPAKFGSTVKSAIGRDPVIPERLEKVMNLPDNAIPMEKDYDNFKNWLVNNL